MSRASGPDAETDVTHIGVCVGVDTLIVAASADARLGTELVIDGDHLRERYDVLRAATQALQGAGFDTTAGEAQLFVAVWHQLRPQVYGAAARTVQHAQQFDTPQIVLAERSPTGPSLWARRTSEGLGAWLPAALARAVAEKAREASVPVVRATPTRGTCHDCGESGRIDGRELRCRTESCPVDRVARSRNGAVWLARAGRDE